MIPRIPWVLGLVALSLVLLSEFSRDRKYLKSYSLAGTFDEDRSVSKRNPSASNDNHSIARNTLLRVSYERFLQSKSIPDREKNVPENLHAHYPLQCIVNNNTWPVHDATFPWMVMTYHPYPKEVDRYPYNHPKRTYFSGHRIYHGTQKEMQEQLAMTHACRYTTLELWWELAAQHNIARWIAHGGTAMATHCHHSVNPWDDDIDITVDSCHGLEALMEKGRNVSDVFPDLKETQYRTEAFPTARVITDKLILIQGGRYYKLKHVDEVRIMDKKDLGGIDVQCFDRCIPKNEVDALRDSKMEATLKDSSIPLDVLPFGPTYIQVVPYPVLQSYVKHRYGKDSWCDFPQSEEPTGQGDNLQDTAMKVYDAVKKWHHQVRFGNKSWCDFPHASLLEQNSQDPRSSQVHAAVANWFIHPEKRYNEWLPQVGLTPGKNLTVEVPNLDKVEVDNSIASSNSCRLTNSSNTKPNPKIINFNAERGTHWDKFADMVQSYPELQEPDVIILNEMDIGMARSGNLHTTRKLAFQLGMNYAWGLEFVELTSGDAKEQNRTKGQKDSLALHGNAILSRCNIYDPKIFRDELADIYFSTKSSWQNADGYEKRLGGRMALFARTGSDENHIVVGSVHKLSQLHRPQIYDYLGVGEPPPLPSETQNVTFIEMDQIAAKNNASNPPSGIVLAGDFERELCSWYGLQRLDDAPSPLRKTFRSDCSKSGEKAAGLRRADYFCGNTGMKIVQEDKSFPPCYGTERLQISDHAIMQIVVQ